MMDYFMSDLNQYYFMNYLPLIILLLVALACSYIAIIQKEHNVVMLLITMLCGIGQGAQLFFMGILADNQLLLNGYGICSFVFAGITLILFIMQLVVILKQKETV